MEENIDFLYEDIREVVSNIDSIILGLSLSSISKPTLCVGAGGSKVVAEFANLVFTKKNKIICKTIDARDLNYIDLNLYSCLFVASYSGANTGVKLAMLKNLEKYLLTGRKSRISNETLIHYDLPKRHSFISLNATVVPMAILLKYYLYKDFDIVLDRVFAEIDENLSLSGERPINIFAGADMEVVALFLESTLIEAGINMPIRHYKYDYCHGRSTINKNHENDAINLGCSSSDLDKTLEDVISSTMHESIVLKKISDDDVINNFYLVIQAIYLVRNIARNRGVDLSNIKYDKDAIRKLYYFKGSM